MNFQTAIATILGSTIQSTRIGELSHSDIEMVKDMLEAIGDARTAKESFDVHTRDSLNPMYSATERTDQRRWAEESERDFARAQRRLQDLISDQKEVAA